MMITSIDYKKHKGRIAVGRVGRGWTPLEGSPYGKLSELVQFPAGRLAISRGDCAGVTTSSAQGWPSADVDHQPRL